MSVNPSLQRRLARYMAALIAAGGLVAAGAAYVKAYHDAHELQDAQLQRIARLLVVTLPAKGAVVPDGEATADPDDEIVIDISNTATAFGLSTELVDGKEWRVARQAMPSGSVVTVRQQTEVRDEIARHSALQTLLPLLTLIPVLLGLLTFVIRRTLAPVRVMGEMLDQSASGDPLALPVAGVPVEVLPFVSSVNAMMGRVRETQRRQRRFIADAAHELRTPITALSIQAENLSRVSAPEQAALRMQALQEGLTRTRALLEQLLSLSRFQGREDAGPSESCDVLSVLREVVADLMPVVTDKRIDLGMTHVDAGQIPCAAFDLRVLLANVLSNAIRHVAPGGQIDIAVTHQGSAITLCVDDTGPGISPADLPHVFEAFYKAGDNAAGGTGLGLSIVKAIADRIQAHVTLGPRPDGAAGCRFAFECPIAQIKAPNASPVAQPAPAPPLAAPHSRPARPDRP